MRPVLTKRDFVSRYKFGEFGNAAPTWNNLEELVGDSAKSHVVPTGMFHIRNRVAGGPTFYNLTFGECCDKWIELVELLRYNPRSFYISSMAPHHRGLIQGEVQQGVHGLELFYAPALVPMREALAAAGQQVQGALAVAILKANLCPNSWGWLNNLLDTYQFHVVEFSSFECEWGTVPGYNTVFWEVRSY